MLKKAISMCIAVLMLCTTSMAATWSDNGKTQITGYGENGGIIFQSRDGGIVGSHKGVYYNQYAADSVEIDGTTYIFVLNPYGVYVMTPYNQNDAANNGYNAVKIVADGGTAGFTTDGAAASDCYKLYGGQDSAAQDLPYFGTQNKSWLAPGHNALTIKRSGDKIYLYYSCYYGFSDGNGKYIGPGNTDTGAGLRPCVRKIDITNPLKPVEAACFIGSANQSSKTGVREYTVYFNDIFAENGLVYAIGQDFNASGNNVVGTIFEDADLSSETDKTVSVGTEIQAGSKNWLCTMKNGVIYTVGQKDGSGIEGTGFGISASVYNGAVKVSEQTYELPVSLSAASANAIRGICSNDKYVFIDFVNTDNTDMTKTDSNEGILVYEIGSGTGLTYKTLITMPEISNGLYQRWIADRMAISKDGSTLYLKDGYYDDADGKWNNKSNGTVIGISIKDINNPMIVYYSGNQNYSYLSKTNSNGIYAGENSVIGQNGREIYYSHTENNPLKYSPSNGSWYLYAAYYCPKGAALKGGNIIIAMYDSSNTLLGFKTQTISADDITEGAVNGGVARQLSISETGMTDVAKIKVFGWTSFDTLIPLMDSFTYIK